MLKKLFTFSLSLCLFASCYKTQTVTPTIIQTPTALFKDTHINVVEVKTLQTAARTVEVSFTTRYEVDINKIEVYRGTSKNNLCVFYEKNISQDSYDFKTYKTTDTEAGASINYYMIRYYTPEGETSYSPLYQVLVK